MDGFIYIMFWSRFYSLQMRFHMVYLSIASTIGKYADMPSDASGLADCSDTEQRGSQFADQQEFDALYCMTQGKQETEASSVTPS